MNGRCLALCLTVMAAGTLMPTVASDQTLPSERDAWVQSLTPWGDPDLQGVWTNTTTTPLQRPRDLADKEFLTAEELAVRDRQVADKVNLDKRARDSPVSETGAYNNFWMERGRLGTRTSLIVDPADGRLPPMTSEEEVLQSQRRSTYSSSRFDSVADFNELDRCISRGMPGAMMPGFYNHNYQILQTPDYVTILVEMVHDVRIIPMDGRGRLDPTVRQWLGDARGHWEGNTLVVETTNFADKVNGRQELGHTQGGGTVFGGDENLRLVERFTRVSADMIDYEFTVVDPTVWQSPWRASLPMTAIEGPLFEYACHEGNYALGNILAGARLEETVGQARER
jgi:hypothetical protein